MIELSRIQIDFERTVLKDSSIRIPKGRMTVVTGKEASGKTSLLSLLGLITCVGKADYVFEGRTLDLANQEQRETVRKENFGFLPQTPNLAANLDIRSQIAFMGKLNGHDLTEEDVCRLADEVGLERKLLASYPGMLSAGEQQQAALATILAKNPSCVFADEPISSLDSSSRRKMAVLLRKLTDRGITLCCMAQEGDDELISKADVVYCLQNKRVELLWGSPEEEGTRPEGEPEAERSMQKNRPLKKALFYVRKSRHRANPVQKTVVILCAVALAFFALLDSFLGYLRTGFEAGKAGSAQSEIYVKGSSAEKGRPVSREVLEKTAVLKGVTGVYPVMSFPSSYSYGTEGPLETADITVRQGNEVRVIPADEFGERNGRAAFSLVSRNERETNQVPEEGQKKTDGVYLSFFFARRLGISGDFGESEPVFLTVTVGVPLRTLRFENGDETSFDTLYAPLELTVRVDGVLMRSALNSHIGEGSMFLSLPLEMMEEIREATEREVSPESYVSHFHGEETATQESWSSNGFLVYWDGKADYSELCRRIGALDKNLFISNTNGVSNRWAKLFRTSELVIEILVAGGFAVACILLGTLFYSRTAVREKEFARLRIQGMSRGELMLTVVTECLETFVHILAVSVPLTLLVFLVLNFVKLEISSVTCLRASGEVIVMALGAIIVPSLIATLTSIRIQPVESLKQ